jgi:enamine deaminase RidA (YjgF/YER057c/UK114 family)
MAKIGSQDMTGTAPLPIGQYEPFAMSGGLIAISAISSARDGQLITGKIGRDVDFGTAQGAARRAADNLISVLNDALGGNEFRLDRILMVRGYVNAIEGYPEIHKIVDAASERIIQRLGEKGRHARTAVGCATLPNNNVVTLEALAMTKAG